MSREDDRRYEEQRQQQRMNEQRHDAQLLPLRVDQVRRDEQREDDKRLEDKRLETALGTALVERVHPPMTTPSLGPSPSHSQSYSTPPDPSIPPRAQQKKVGRGVAWAALFGLAVGVVGAVVKAVKQKATEPDSLPPDDDIQ